MNLSSNPKGLIKREYVHRAIASDLLRDADHEHTALCCACDAVHARVIGRCEAMRFSCGDRRLGWQIMSKRSEAGGGDAGGEGHKRDSAQSPHGQSASLEILKLADTQRQRVPGSDPYNSAPVPTVPVPRHPRRDLDALRQLSTPNKPATAGERPAIAPTSDLALRLAGMRVDLERVLSDMEALRASTVDSANRKAVGLMLQLRLAARHLEDAIDSLLPQDEP